MSESPTGSRTSSRAAGNGSPRSRSRTSSWRSPGCARRRSSRSRTSSGASGRSRWSSSDPTHVGKISEDDIRLHVASYVERGLISKIAIPENVTFVDRAAADLGRQDRQEEAARQLSVDRARRLTWRYSAGGGVRVGSPSASAFSRDDGGSPPGRRRRAAASPRDGTAPSGPPVARGGRRWRRARPDARRARGGSTATTMFSASVCRVSTLHRQDTTPSVGLKIEVVGTGGGARSGPVEIVPVDAVAAREFIEPPGVGLARVAGEGRAERDDEAHHLGRMLGELAGVEAAEDSSRSRLTGRPCSCHSSRNRLVRPLDHAVPQSAIDPLAPARGRKSARLQETPHQRGAGVARRQSRQHEHRMSVASRRGAPQRPASRRSRNAPRSRALPSLAAEIRGPVRVRHDGRPLMETFPRVFTRLQRSVDFRQERSRSGTGLFVEAWHSGPFPQPTSTGWTNFRGPERTKVRGLSALPAPLWPQGGAGTLLVARSSAGKVARRPGRSVRECRIAPRGWPRLRPAPAGLPRRERCDPFAGASDSGGEGARIVAAGDPLVALQTERAEPRKRRRVVCVAERHQRAGVAAHRRRA